MSVIAPDQAVVANGSFQINTEGYQSDVLAWIVLTNASAFELQASVGSQVIQVPAWYYYPVNLRDSNGNPLPGLALPMKITVGSQSIPGTAGIAVLHTALYLTNEPPPANTQPGPLAGSPINLSIATQVVNNGNPPATSIVFGAPLSDTGATQINNDGTATFGDTAYPGSVTITSGNIKIVLAAGVLTIYDALGNALNSIDQNGRLTLGNSSQDGQLVINQAGVVLNGSTSGTAILYEVLRGTIKMVVVKFNNYKNGSVPAQTIALPTAFTAAAQVMTDDISPTQFLASGVAQNVFVLTTLAGTGGARTTETSIGSHSQGEVATAFDTLSFAGSQPSAHSGLIIIQGI